MRELEEGMKRMEELKRKVGEEDWSEEGKESFIQLIAIKIATKKKGKSDYLFQI